MTVRIRVPGSTANLGSGFDALGLALGVYDEIELTPRRTGAVEVSGEGAGEVPCSEEHLVLRAMRTAQRVIGSEPQPVELRCANEIPHSRGLGSSAAAISAGVAAAYALAGRELDTTALQLAAEFEGHADNVAASLFGGLALTWCEHGQYRAAMFAAHPELRPVALVPQQRSATHAARGLLPETVPHADAAFAAGRAALAVHALTSAPDLLFAATEDRLHQDYRRPAWPSSLELVERLRAAGVPAVISGAGPTVLAFGPLPEGLAHPGFRASRLPVAAEGVQVAVEGAQVRSC